ncbi:MAG: hypothetical protein K0Q50_199 [Vampirovibrio sp.]|jgi:cytochrome c-type biogenesis protein CcmH/NrfG|nr:hypothetical protein [Vampirovibrio sp.]
MMKDIQSLYDQAAEAFLCQQDPKRALELIEAHLEKNPNDVSGWTLKADIYYCTNQDWNAAKCYTQAAKILTRK